MTSFLKQCERQIELSLIADLESSGKASRKGLLVRSMVEIALKEGPGDQVRVAPQLLERLYRRSSKCCSDGEDRAELTVNLFAGQRQASARRNDAHSVFKQS